MKFLQIIFTVSVLFILNACAPTANIEGQFTHVYAEVAGEEFKFINQPNKFTYYSRTEGSIRQYSKGYWFQDGKSIILSGFNDTNLNVLELESKIEDNLDESIINVQYKPNPFDTFIKVDIIINENSKMAIRSDTSILLNNNIHSLHIKSYLLHEGLLFQSPPLIDTLYSRVLSIDDSNKKKNINLKFKIDWADFFRIKINDTLGIVNSRRLLLRNVKFNKIKAKLKL